MIKNPKIDLIKKCKQDTRTLSLQETNNALGLEANNCSTFLSWSGLLAQGEGNNKKQNERNALITFRDPATGKLKGWDSGFCEILVAAFLFLVSCIIL